MTFALKFFPHWLMCIHLCFSFVNYSSGILSSVLNRIFPQILCQLPQILNFYFFFNKMFVVILTKFAGHLSVTSVLYLNKFKSVYGISDTQMSTSGLYFLLLVPQEANQGQIFKKLIYSLCLLTWEISQFLQEIFQECFGINFGRLWSI